MKNLLSVLAVSTLVGTSASNLKPVFTNNIINHGFKSNQLNNKDISITNQKDVNPFSCKPLITGIASDISVTSVIIAGNGIVYAGTDGKGLWKSTDGLNFEQVKGLSNTMFVTSIVISKNGTIYVGQTNNVVGLYKSTDGLNFEAVDNDDVQNIICLTTNADGNVYAATDGKGLWKSTDGNTFISMSGIQGEIKSLTTDKDSNIYAGSSNGTVYKSNGTDTFTAMTGTSGEIKSLTTDKDSNIYAGTNKGLDGLHFIGH